MKDTAMNFKHVEQVSAGERDAAAGGAAVSRVAHGEQGVVRTTFVLHPSHARLARSLDKMEQPRSPIQAAAARGTQEISRESVLRAMLVAHAQGLTAAEFSVVILGRNDERAVHRISAHLAREAKRGLVTDEKGRGVKRRLTHKGRDVAAQMEIAFAQGKARPQASAQAAACGAQQARINGVFGYARTIELGLAGRKGSVL